MSMYVIRGTNRDEIHDYQQACFKMHLPPVRLVRDFMRRFSMDPELRAVMRSGWIYNATTDEMMPLTDEMKQQLGEPVLQKGVE